MKNEQNEKKKTVNKKFFIYFIIDLFIDYKAYGSNEDDKSENKENFWDQLTETVEKIKESYT